MTGPSALFRPLQIGAITVPNRIMQTAHSKLFSDRVESERETAYFVRRAQGGCGLFVAGNHFVHPSASIPNFQDAFRPGAIDADRRMTDAVHDAGARILVQLNHHGAQAFPDGPDGPRPVYAPSRLISPSNDHVTRAATRADIQAFTEGWARSAEYAQAGGFDGVEVHMAHGYLLHQFLSPLYNARTDEYGGDLEGRTRFAREVLRAVRERVGGEFAVGIRIVANEFHPGGLDGAAMREVIARLRAEVRLDFIDLAAGGYHNVHYVFPSSPMPVAWLREEAAAVKRANADVPVFSVGAALSVEQAEEVIESGVADMVALTRGQIADPDLASKLRTGRAEEIQHCIRLNQGCLGRGSNGLPMSCTVNPLAGRELLRGPRVRAAVAQRWLVVGGGPAGMRAAVELASDGHSVTLFERAEELGGQLLLAQRVPGREGIGLLVDDLRRQLASSGVAVRLGVDVTADLLAAEGAGGVVVATGAVAPETTSLEVGGAYVGGFPPRGVVPAHAALADPAALGRRIAVVDSDGTAYASGVVLTLLSAVEELELVTPYETAFPHVGAGYVRPLLFEQLAAHGGFRRWPSQIVETVGSGALVVRDTLTSVTTTLDGLHSIVALEPRESVGLGRAGPATSLEVEGARVMTIGDAVAPRTIDSAIHDAVELAYAVGGHLGTPASTPSP